MKTAARSLPTPAARIKVSDDSVTKYGVRYERIGYTAFDKDGAKIRFAWIEQSRFNREEWSANKWSDVVGKVNISSRCFQTKEQAEVDARQYVQNG